RTSAMRCLKRFDSHLLPLSNHRGRSNWWQNCHTVQKTQGRAHKYKDPNSCRGECGWTSALGQKLTSEPQGIWSVLCQERTCQPSSHFQGDDLLLNFLTLSDKSVYCRVSIGGGRKNVRLSPLVDQFLDIDSQSRILGPLH